VYVYKTYLGVYITPFGYIRMNLIRIRCNSHRFGIRMIFKLNNNNREMLKHIRRLFTLTIDYIQL